MAYHNKHLGKIGYVYILSNYTKEVLYIGVCSDLKKRISQHKNGIGSKFTSEYKIKYLMYYEVYPNINEAIAREKQLKNWHKEWKWNLIKEKNPNLNDLWNQII